MVHGKPIVEQTDPDILSDYSLQLNRWLLKSIGAWPKSFASTKMEIIISLILATIGYTTILITVVPGILNLILEDHDARTKLVLVGPLSHWCLGGIGYTTLLMHDKEIKWCVERVKNDWRAVINPELQQRMIRDAKIGRYVVTLCAILMQGAVLVFNVEKALSTQVIAVGNETKVVHNLPCATYKELLPVDTSPTFEIVLAAQFISGLFVNSTFAGAFSLASAFTLHAYSQLNILAMWITEAVDQSRERVASLDDIGAIVRKHLAILSFISRIEAIMNEICFMELFKCTFSICLLGYDIILEWTERNLSSMFSYMCVSISMSFNIFLLCFIGETIKEECDRIGETVYMTNWYYLPNKDIFDLMMIISRSCVETKITAGKIAHMSFYTFASVMKTGFAYMNILLQTT